MDLGAPNPARAWGRTGADRAGANPPSKDVDLEEHEADTEGAQRGDRLNSLRLAPVVARTFTLFATVATDASAVVISPPSPDAASVTHPATVADHHPISA